MPPKRQDPVTHIAALLTVHNRKAKTLSALDSLERHVALLPGAIITAYVVDDGSTDGSGAAIADRFPQVRLLHGDGKLFWNGGMRLAFAEAMRQGFDYYLWLNDDTNLYHDALCRMLQGAARSNDNAIIVGSIRDPDSGQLTYGGVRQLSRWRPFKFTWISPENTEVEVDTMNGNCVLIPRSVADRVGNLDPAFTHGIGDFDYGLRASRLGIRVLLVAGYVGECKRNSLRGSWIDPSFPLTLRVRKAIGPHGFPPRELAVFAKRYAGFFWPIYWALAYRRLFFPQVFTVRDD